MKNSSSTLLFFSGYPHQPTDMKIKSSEKKKFNQPLLLAGRQKTKTDLADNPKNWDETWFGNYE
jgi:hypothetical protein